MHHEDEAKFDPRKLNLDETRLGLVKLQRTLALMYPGHASNALECASRSILLVLGAVESVARLIGEAKVDGLDAAIKNTIAERLELAVTYLFVTCEEMDISIATKLIEEVEKHLKHLKG